MKRNRFTDEQIVAALRDAEATTMVEAARMHGVAEQTMYRWRKRFAGMDVSEVRELKRLKDEATGFCLAIRTERCIQHQDVKKLLRELVARYGRPRAIRSDNGSELVAAAFREEMEKQHIRLANIEPGKPWQNGSCESFNGTFRKERLNAEVFSCLTEARVMIEKWRCRYNERRPHRSQKLHHAGNGVFWIT